MYKQKSELTQPHLAHGRLLVLLRRLLLLGQALDLGLWLAALGRFGFGKGLVGAALLGCLDLFGRRGFELVCVCVMELDLVLVGGVLEDDCWRWMFKMGGGLIECLCVLEFG